MRTTGKHGDGRGVLRATVGSTAWWWAGYAVAVLPRSLVVLARAGAPAATATRVQAVALGLSGVPVGLWAWVAALLLVPNTVRNLAWWHQV